MRQKVVLATGNQGKVKEMVGRLETFGFDIVSQKELSIESVEETGLTFVENAILKARHASEVSGLPAIADDSGLVVEALGGAPGLYSSRYAGEDGNDAKNRQKLISEMTQFSGAERRAKFVCVIVMLMHPKDPFPIIAIGECYGEILNHERGENGFGYDSLFYYKEFGKTFAEVAPEEKKLVSHRAIALKSLQQQLQAR